jgi:hypothetical protein
MKLPRAIFVFVVINFVCGCAGELVSEVVERGIGFTPSASNGWL